MTWCRRWYVECRPVHGSVDPCVHHVRRWGQATVVHGDYWSRGRFQRFIHSYMHRAMGVTGAAAESDIVAEPVQRLERCRIRVVSSLT